MPSFILSKVGQIFLHALCISVSAQAGDGQQEQQQGRGRGSHHAQCKSIPGSADWPSDRSWNRFNESLGGRLLQPAPAGAVCHQGQRTYDPEQCPAVTDGWRTYEFHAEHPSSVFWNQFSNDSCLPDPSYPCDNAGYPAFVVNATEAEHVQLAINFARKNNVRLNVKGTGHDYIGRSNAPASLSIWTHHMKGIEYHEGSFQPKKCRKPVEGNAVTARAGVQMIEVYQFTDRYNETIVGGGGNSVGVGGYITGAGHSLLSARYGLAADQVLEMELVTPAGKVITANECQNEDLFWAMRGGGGSTFGVLLSVTLKTYPSPKIVHAEWGLISPIGDPNVVDWQTYFVSKFPAMESQGLYGYNWIITNVPNPIDPESPPIDGLFGKLVLLDAEQESDMLSLMEPIVEDVKAKFPDSNIVFLPDIRKYDSFLSWFGDHFDPDEGGRNLYLGSRLLSAEHMEYTEELKTAIKTSLDEVGHMLMFIVSGKGVREAGSKGGGNSVVPAWRKAIVHAIATTEFEPLNKTAEEEAISKLTRVTDKLKALAPDSGAYMNEASSFEPDYQNEFWGDNYGRLLGIKRRVDPHDVFWCTPCVGNERWEEVGNQLCRV